LSPKLLTCPSDNYWKFKDYGQFKPPGSYYSSYVYVGNPFPVGITTNYWRNINEVAQTITDSQPSDRLLAADVIYGGVFGPGNLDGSWFVANHGPIGLTGDKSKFLGINKLFLDGHVDWKIGTQFPPFYNLSLSNQAPDTSSMKYQPPGNNTALYW